MAGIGETTKAISELTMASSSADSTTTITTSTITASSFPAPSKKALKRELKMIHKEEEKIRKGKKPVKGLFEARYGKAWLDGQVIPFDQARVIIFKDLKEKAEAGYGNPISRAVIILPANVNDAKLHQMIKDAATTAGLDVQRIIVNGPNADEYPYGLRRRHGDPITSFDLSGPCYVTNISQYHNIPKLCFPGEETNSSNLLEHTMEYMKMAHGADFTQDPSAVQRLREALEKASVSKSKVTIKLPVADGDQFKEKTVTIRDLPF